jgi:hypothetical protein
MPFLHWTRRPRDPISVAVLNRFRHLHRLHLSTRTLTHLVSRASPRKLGDSLLYSPFPSPFRFPPLLYTLCLSPRFFIS